MATVVTRLFIGRVKTPPHKAAAYHFATVDPLFESDPSGTKWIGPVGDAVGRFPKRGFVHWHEAPITAVFGSLWQFSIDESGPPEREDRTEQVRLADPEEPVEVLDFRGWVDEMSLRSALSDQGVELAQQPLSRRIVIWLASGLCVGPLHLKRGADAALWVLDGPETHRDAARLPAWRLASNEISEVVLDGPRLLLSPGHTFSQSAGIQNWLPDAQVLRGVLKRLRKQDPKVVTALKVTDKVFDGYLEILASAGFSGIDSIVERARAERLRGIRSAIQNDRTLLGEISSALIESEGVRADLERQAEAERARLFDEKRVEVDASLEGRRSDLSEVELELKRRRDALADIEREIVSKTAGFELEVTRRLEEIAKRPEVAFAENAVLRAALGPLVGAFHPVQNRATEVHDADSLGTDSPRGALVISESALASQLARLAIAAGISLASLLGLHATLLAGVVPIVFGDDAYELVRLYASALTGGRLRWIPVGSSLLEAQDLLGRFDPSARRIIPHPAGVLDLIRDSAASGVMELVVLEGFNRAPVEAYLLPILESARAGRIGDRARAIPLASHRIVARDDPYRDQTTVVWPPNLLVVCIPAEGTATLPVPSSAWAYLAMIDADDRDRERVSLRGESAPAISSTLTEATALTWQSWVHSPTSLNETETESVFAQLVAALGLSRRDCESAVAVDCGLRRNGVPADQARGLAASCVLVPRTKATAATISQALLTVGIVSAPSWQVSAQQAHRIGQ